MITVAHLLAQLRATSQADAALRFERLIGCAR